MIYLGTKQVTHKVTQHVCKLLFFNSYVTTKANSFGIRELPFLKSSLRSDLTIFLKQPSLAMCQVCGKSLKRYLQMVD